MKKYCSLLLFSIILLGCEAAENLLTERKSPNVGPIQSITGTNANPGDTLQFTVNATNPEDGELSYEWSANGGSFIGSINETTIKWKSPLSGGTYRISVEVSNNYKSDSKFIDINVWSNANPIVKIIYPTNGTYLVQHTPVKIEFESFHENDIAWNFIFINNQKIDSLPGRTGIFLYAYEYWSADAPAGNTNIKVEAVSVNNTYNSDHVNVIIEGILPGKGND